MQEICCPDCGSVGTVAEQQEAIVSVVVRFDPTSTDAQPLAYGRARDTSVLDTEPTYGCLNCDWHCDDSITAPGGMTIYDADSFIEWLKSQKWDSND